MKLRTVCLDDAAAMAALHARAFERAWGEDEIAVLLDGMGGFGAIIDDAGFILCRMAAGEAEILTLAVDPAMRRLGAGRALVEAGAALALAAGAGAFFLEVAADNDAALALYEAAGFARAGLRPGYYRRQVGDMDAIVMRRALNTGA